MVWRSTAGLALALLMVAGSARAQSYSLAEAPLTGTYFRIELDMSLVGELKVQQEGKPVALKQTAVAQHIFLERILEVGKSGLADKSARIYRSAKARISVDKDSSERTFRPERCFLVAQRVKDQAVAYCPNGLLTRQELELTEHFDTLSLPGLLPTGEVKAGDTWKVANAAVQSLLDLDGLINQDLTCKLDKVEGDTAQVLVTGTASGIASGAAAKMTVAASCRFDLKAHRLIYVEWNQTDQRDQGPVTPGFTAQVVIKLKRTPVEPVNELNDDFLAGKLAPSVPEALTKLTYRDPQARYELVHGRDWHLVSRSERQMVLRLMDQGDFVAQATITPWKKAEPGKHLAEEEFKEAMAQTPGWEQEAMADKGTKIDDPVNKYWIYRIAVSGALNGVKAVQYFYVVAGPQGDQMVIAFTVPPPQAQKLNTRDLDMIRGLRLLDRASQLTPVRVQGGIGQ
jgi:hypothetical protein